MRPTSLVLGGALLSVALPLLGHSAARAQAGLTYPNPGVVCDAAGPACYDSKGPSVDLTEQVFGRRAAYRLARNLVNSDSRDFRLSTGQACILAKRTCFDDGWSQRNVANKLTQRVFGASSGGDSLSDDKKVIRDAGTCRLTRSGETMFDGACQMKQVLRDGQNTFVITLENGNRYVFKQAAGGGYSISDGFGGTWPATFTDKGQSGVFRFGDYKLVARQSSGSSSSSSGSGSRPQTKEEATGEAFGNFLKAIFSNP